MGRVHPKVHFCGPDLQTAPLYCTVLYCRCEHSQPMVISTCTPSTPSKFISYYTNRAAVCGKIPDKLSQFIPCSTICTAVEASLTRRVHLCCQMKRTETCQFLL